MLPDNLLLLTNLNPAIAMTSSSNPSTTANVTIAPMTPATALEIPVDVGCVLGAGVALAQTPVLLPHA